MNSCLYECTVMHRRIAPKKHEFVYRIFLFLFDLEELPEIERRVPFFSVNTPNLYSLRDEDYFQFHSRGIRQNLETFLSTQNLPVRPARIQLLTLPRLLTFADGAGGGSSCGSHCTRIGDPLSKGTLSRSGSSSQPAGLSSSFSHTALVGLGCLCEAQLGHIQSPLVPS